MNENDVEEGPSSRALHGKSGLQGLKSGPVSPILSANKNSENCKGANDLHPSNRLKKNGDSELKQEEDFASFNDSIDSDLLLAVVDVESLPSAFTKNQERSPDGKRICFSVKNPEFACDTINISKSVSKKHQCNSLALISDESGSSEWNKNETQIKTKICDTETSGASVCVENHGSRLERDLESNVASVSDEDDLFGDDDGNCNSNNTCTSSLPLANTNLSVTDAIKEETMDLDQSLSEYFFHSSPKKNSNKSKTSFTKEACKFHSISDKDNNPRSNTRPVITDSRLLVDNSRVSKNSLLQEATCDSDEKSQASSSKTVFQADGSSLLEPARKETTKPLVGNIENSSSSSSSINPGKTAVLSKDTSLKNKVRLRLQQNTAGSTSFRNVEEDIKREALCKARLDASQIRKEGTKVDIGPFYGLPCKVQQLFQTCRGITKLYDWQDECLQLEAVKECRNLIYSLPTSGGKTLVAEILIMRQLLCYKKDVLLVLPFVSIVQEKVRTISEFATELGFLVEEYAGSKGRFPPIKRREKHSLYIATIEKAHSLINSHMETGRIHTLGLIVVDELHMIGEGGSRGATLESLLLKIIYCKCNIQIVGMSATLNNIKDLQDFLNAEVFNNDFRPVKLQEMVKVEDNLFSINHKALNPDEKLQHERIITFPYTSEVQRQDPDHLLGLVLEIIPDGSCLVFCPTKKNCENVALMLSKLMCKHHRHLSAVKREERKQLLKELHRDGQGKMCPVLEYTIHFGIAYHHSGLTMDERHLIEEAYSEGSLCLLMCTSTLAAGVNLPAKRVILRSPYVGMSFLKYSQYKQMTGRAGRAGLDTSGDSILIVKKQDRTQVKELLSGPEDFCHSSLSYDEGKGVKNLLLSAIGLGIVTSPQSCFELMEKSLLQIQASKNDTSVAEITRQSLQHLKDMNLVIQSATQEDPGSNKAACLHITSLGKATFKGSVDHTFCRQLHKDLKTAEESLNLSSHLHLLYLVTPYDTAMTVIPDWTVYFHQFCKLSDTERKVADLIGVPESYIGLKAAGQFLKRKICELTINRFYLTLMLWDLWNQKSLWEVADKFSQSRGFIQNLLSQTSAFASCVFHFCQELEEFWAYQDLLGNFVKRLSYCVSMELIPLMEIPGVKLSRAKELYAKGYKNMSLLALADAGDLSASVEHLSKQAARQIISAAKNIVEEKTAALMEEVDSLKTPAVTHLQAGDDGL